MIISQVSVTVMNSEMEESILRMRALLNLQMTHKVFKRCDVNLQDKIESEANSMLHLCIYQQARFRLIVLKHNLYCTQLASLLH